MGMQILLKRVIGNWVMISLAELYLGLFDEYSNFFMVQQ